MCTVWYIFTCFYFIIYRDYGSVCYTVCKFLSLVTLVVTTRRGHVTFLEFFVLIKKCPNQPTFHMWGQT